MNHNIIALARGALLNSGRYRIERELNRGATAVVYAAEDTSNHTYVALKVMNGPDQVPIKVVKREITFSSSMSHENIVRLLDVFAEKSQLVIVWELISGPDLLDLLNECSGRMPEDMAAFYFAQLLKAVLFMHKNGFCHRDIKPENCMVQRNSYMLKLIDFGLSKHLESAQTLGVGTPDYMCPELLQHNSSAAAWGRGPGAPNQQQAPYDARAVDAWAMGVLLYLLVTGKYPFEDPNHPNNLAHTINNVLAGRVRPFSDSISQGCTQLVHDLLQIRPENRRTLTDIVHDEWLISQSQQYASRVGRLDLIDLQQYKDLSLPATHTSELGGAELGNLNDMDIDHPGPTVMDDQAVEGHGTKSAGKSAIGKVCNYLRRKLA